MTATSLVQWFTVGQGSPASCSRRVAGDNRPMSSSQQRRPVRSPASSASPRPLSDAERDELQAILDRVPAPLEPLDVSLLDGFLCGVLVQPERLPPRRWLRYVTDVDGRALPAGFEVRRLEQLVERRYLELDDAIGRRQWFDPWVYELDEAPGESADRKGVDAAGSDAELRAEDDDAPPPAETQAVYPWVAGFATALELFPALTQHADARALDEALALLYQHLAADDLEDADELLETIASLAPPENLAEAVEGLVRATLLLADLGRPLAKPAGQRAARSPGRR